MKDFTFSLFSRKHGNPWHNSSGCKWREGLILPYCFLSRWSSICRNLNQWASAVSSTREESEKTLQLLEHPVSVHCRSITTQTKTFNHLYHFKPLSLSLSYTFIKGCCQWKEQDRLSLAEVSRKLISGEKTASDKVLKASGAISVEQYLQEAGYGESNSYTVFWPAVCANKKMHYSQTPEWSTFITQNFQVQEVLQKASKHPFTTENAL